MKRGQRSAVSGQGQLRSWAWLGLILALGLAIAPAGAANMISLTVTVTNVAGTTNGQTLTVNGDTRTWSTNVSTTHVLTNASAAVAATNLFNALVAFPFSGLAMGRGSSTALTFQAAPGAALVASVSAGWGTVVLTTNVLTSATLVRIPLDVETDAGKTNIASGLVAYIDNDKNTNVVRSTAPALANFVGKDNTQTISGAKTLTNVANQFVGYYLGNGGALSNVNGGAVTGAVALASSATYAVLATNATIAESATNVLVAALTNKVYGSNVIGTVASATNWTGQFSSNFYNGSFSGDGSGLTNVAGGGGGGASFTVMWVDHGDATSWTNANTGAAVTIGDNATTNIVFTADGYGTFLNTVSANILTATTLIDGPHSGNGSGLTALDGTELQAGTVSTNAFDADTLALVLNGGSNLTTNNLTNIAFPRRAVSTLSNGSNTDVPCGTNVFLEVSGPTGSFTICGMDGQSNRDGLFKIILNQTGQNMTIAHESGSESTAANRIVTMTGSDFATTGNGAAILIYNSNSSRWILLNLEQ